MEALNKIRTQDDINQGLTVAEADAVEQALWESRQVGKGRWVDLLRKTHRGRTIVSSAFPPVFLLHSSRVLSLYHCES